MDLATPDDILSFWFGPIDADAYPARRDELWWSKNPEVDAECRARFLDTWAAAGRGELAGWKQTPRGRLALVIVLDQLSRNMHRDRPEMYAYDDEAVDVVLEGIEAGADRALTSVEQVFFYMPLMHVESVPLQRMCVRVFARLVEEARPAERDKAQMHLDFAERHAVIVERFGRFPHRNTILGRQSSAEERAFLEQPGSSF